jgi:hypothetical protein
MSALDQVQQFLFESRLNRDQTLAFKSALTITEILYSNQCCLRCCLRYLGCAHFSPYALEEKVNKAEINSTKNHQSNVSI